MSRVTTANRCAQEMPVLLAGRTVVVVCQKAEAHAGPHQGKVQWAPKCAAPRTGRRI